VRIDISWPLHAIDHVIIFEDYLPEFDVFRYESGSLLPDVS
jgi:hypothetical protein